MRRLFLRFFMEFKPVRVPQEQSTDIPNPESVPAAVRTVEGLRGPGYPEETPQRNRAEVALAAPCGAAG